MLCSQHACSTDDDPLNVDLARRGIAQHGRYSNAFNENQSKIDNRTRGATIADVDISYLPGTNDRFFFQLRYANGNALNNTGGLAVVPYGGELNGSLWSRPGDEIGFAFGRANGESGSSWDHGSATEAYLRVRLSEASDISLDIQYAKESSRDSGTPGDPELLVIGLRFNSHFGF